MKSKRSLIIALLALVLVAGSLKIGALVGRHYLWGRVAVAHAQSMPSAVAPTYSVQIHTEAHSLTPGSGIRADHIYGQRSNGDFVTIRLSKMTEAYPSPFPPGTISREIKLQSVGLIVLANNQNSNISTFGDGVPVIYHDDGIDNCQTRNGTDWSGEHKQIMGFDVYRTYQNAAFFDRERWVAPRLGCISLLTTVNWRKKSTEPNPGAPDGTTIDTAVSASTLPPEDSMFSLPVNAVEMKPSQYFAALGDTTGDYSSMDKAYFDSAGLRITMISKLRVLIRKFDAL